MSGNMQDQLKAIRPRVRQTESGDPAECISINAEEGVAEVPIPGTRKTFKFDISDTDCQEIINNHKAMQRAQLEEKLAAVRERKANTWLNIGLGVAAFATAGSAMYAAYRGSQGRTQASSAV